jgi:hypothetical protein
MMSECCGAPQFGDWEICSQCLEHCDFEEEFLTPKTKENGTI